MRRKESYKQVDNLDSSRIKVNLYIWEFGQNDPKRDSGSKLFRMKLARQLKIGEKFNGIVLSADAKIVISPLDREIVLKSGIAGINCSWNRLEEIPNDKMGKRRFQRFLPFLVAANSVNYGRPYKMNTAEAIAACLYITGFTEEAEILLEPFSYGIEFLRLNYEGLELYRQSQSIDEIMHYHYQYEIQIEDNKIMKEQRRNPANGVLCEAATGSNITSQYLDDMDLPPVSIDEEDYEDEDEVVKLATSTNYDSTFHVNEKEDSTSVSESGASFFQGKNESCDDVEDKDSDGKLSAETTKLGIV